MLLIPGVPNNPGSFHISARVDQSCCKTGYDFDPNDYKPGLHPFVTREEFYQSITNIRNAINNQTSSAVTLRYLSIAIILGGFVLFIVGGITAVNSQTTGFPPLVGVGFGLFFLGGIISVISNRFYISSLISTIQRAVSVENTFYQNKPDRPSSWTFINNSLYLNRRIYLAQSYIEINIGGQYANPNIQPQGYVYSNIPQNNSMGYYQVPQSQVQGQGVQSQSQSQGQGAQSQGQVEGSQGYGSVSAPYAINQINQHEPPPAYNYNYNNNIQAPRGNISDNYVPLNNEPSNQKCVHCKKLNPLDSQFCGSCGNPLSS